MTEGARANPPESPLLLIKKHEGLAMAQKIGAIGYMECSAALNHQVIDVFHKTFRAIFPEANQILYLTNNYYF